MSQGPQHRRRPDHGPVAHLDDLFTVTEEAPPRRARLDQRRPWLIRGALQTFISSAIVYTALHIVNLDPPYGLILAVCAGAVLVRLAVRSTAEPGWLRAREAVRPVQVRRRNEPGAWYEGGDGMLDAVRRWDRRFDWGTGAPERFAATVGARLGELADERLRQHHGLTRASDPARARALLGDEFWALTQPAQRVPTPRQVAAALTRLEKMQDDSSQTGGPQR